MVPTALRQSFADRNELIGYCRTQFAESALISDEVSEMLGGRQAAERLLDQVHAERYGRDRNFLDGSVTRLSPYIRQGIVSLAEIRRKALVQGRNVGKFISELAWRDYWQRLYEQLGDGVWSDREPYKTGLEAESYKHDLPQDIPEARTGLVCMDSFARELHETGYLHNHTRMWMAAYVVHFRRVRWQAGARWFLEHLLDGDPASNNLSWQWVASTFASKPYFFNRENLEKYTKGRFCRICPQYGKCDFEGEYEVLAERLFQIEVAS